MGLGFFSKGFEVMGARVVIDDAIVREVKIITPKNPKTPGERLTLVTLDFLGGSVKRFLDGDQLSKIPPPGTSVTARVLCEISGDDVKLGRELEVKESTVTRGRAA